MTNTNPTFRFTEESLKEFDSHFNFQGELEDGLWVYEDRNNELVNEVKGTQYKQFTVQLGYSGVQYIDNFNPNGMTLEEIIERIKRPSNTDNN